MRHPLSILAAVALAIALGPASRSPAQTAAPVEVRILAINDFHGNLRPPPGGIAITDPGDNARKITVAAGGAEHMATLVRQLRDGHKNTVFVAAGDLIGASPFLSAMFHDEPTIESLSMMGLEIASVGNHEFDEGKDELLRMQNGGCHPVDNCQGPHPFPGAKFHYLAAGTVEKSTGKTVLPAYEIREFDGIPAGDYNECPGISGPIVDIVRKFDPAVDVVISGHTHRAYVCEVDGRLVTSGDKYGTIVTTIDLKLDPATRDVVSARADNVIVRTGAYANDPEQTALLAAYDKFAAPVANRPAGSISETLSRTPNQAGESPLGDIIADAQLAATSTEANGAAVIAFTNPGGIRTDIAKREQGAVTYADVFASQPFRNQLVTLTLTGMQIKNMLEQQWLDPKRPRILQVSKGFNYIWDAARPYGERVIADRMSLAGQRIDPATSYRVTVNNFLAVGGDGFTVLKEGTAQRFGVYDVDALYAHFQANSPLSPGQSGRIIRLN